MPMNFRLRTLATLTLAASLLLGAEAQPPGGPDPRTAQQCDQDAFLDMLLDQQICWSRWSYAPPMLFQCEQEARVKYNLTAQKCYAGDSPALSTGLMAPKASRPVKKLGK